MRTLYVLLSVVLTAQFAEAQIVSAQLKASGLTCSLCSRSVEMALQKLDFVKSVSMDLETAQAEIQFKEGAKVVIRELPDAVKKAGFSVAELKITGMFEESISMHDACFIYQNQFFQLVENQDVFQSGQLITLTLIGEEYMTRSVYRKHKDKLPLPCKDKDTEHYYVAL